MYNVHLAGNSERRSAFLFSSRWGTPSRILTDLRRPRIAPAREQGELHNGHCIGRPLVVMVIMRAVMVTVKSELDELHKYNIRIWTHWLYLRLKHYFCFNIDEKMLRWSNCHSWSTHYWAVACTSRSLTLASILFSTGWHPSALKREKLRSLSSATNNRRIKAKVQL